MKKLVAPTIHSNGTSKSVLIYPIDDARTAIAVAIGKLKECEPNARDYLIQSDDNFKMAIDQHCERMLALTTTYAQLGVIMEAITNEVFGKITVDENTLEVISCEGEAA